MPHVANRVKFEFVDALDKFKTTDIKKINMKRFFIYQLTIYDKLYLG